jgi:hypothetical protein
MVKFYKSRNPMGSEQPALSYKIMSLCDQALVVCNQCAVSLYYCAVTLYYKYNITEAYLKITAEVVITMFLAQQKLQKCKT